MKETSSAWHKKLSVAINSYTQILTVAVWDGVMVGWGWGQKKKFIYTYVLEQWWNRNERQIYQKAFSSSFLVYFLSHSCLLPVYDLRKCSEPENNSQIYLWNLITTLPQFPRRLWRSSGHTTPKSASFLVCCSFWVEGN